MNTIENAKIAIQKQMASVEHKIYQRESWANCGTLHPVDEAEVQALKNKLLGLSFALQAIALSEREAA